MQNANRFFFSEQKTENEDKKSEEDKPNGKTEEHETK